MLTHLRLTLPEDLTEPTVDLLRRHEWSTNVTLQRGASVEPRGDLVEADVAREQVNQVLDELRRLGASDRGGVLRHDADRYAVRGGGSAGACGTG